MNEDKKEVSQLQVDFGSVQTTTIDGQTCEPQFVERPRQSVATRLFGIGVMSLLLFAVFTHSGFNLVRSVFDYYEVSTRLNDPGYPDPSDGVVTSESLFTLPVDSDSLYLISRGAFQYGTITVEQSTEASDDVIIRIRAAYFKEEAFENANICHLKRQENQNGIGIYASFFFLNTMLWLY
ncbi:uncharacterized protein EDB93DRAFT_1293449 [Suillus bovinus]|uniref:uncharacterized protein n=1 Tax=Suillus bovinus TaxID=48563 RepID=UPI001B867C7B|nr:uncharacterized protein EDB93DRAFT_1293449 [Suillus bovinus]KAG2142310.1 hypothetical protein EDB93DRAFT_1293449 [Suillus bovinus]